MTVDPRTLAARLQGESLTRPLKISEQLAAADLIEQVVVPLHDAWLKANPPLQVCDNCGVTTAGFCCNCDGEVSTHLIDHPNAVPFDKWTAGLVVDDDVFDDRVRDALIDAHNQGVEEGRDPWNKLSMFDIDRIALACAVRLRQIGGAR